MHGHRYQQEYVVVREGEFLLHCGRAVGNLLTSEPQYHESSVVCRGLLKLVSVVCLWPQAVI